MNRRLLVFSAHLSRSLFWAVPPRVQVCKGRARSAVFKLKSYVMFSSFNHLLGVSFEPSRKESDIYGISGNESRKKEEVYKLQARIFRRDTL